MTLNHLGKDEPLIICSPVDSEGRQKFVHIFFCEYLIIYLFQFYHADRLIYKFLLNS